MNTSLSRLRLYAGVLTLSVLLAGCKQIGQQVQNKVEEVAGQAQSALLSEKDLAGISDPLIRKQFVAQANARAYRVVSKSSGRGEGTTTTEIQIVGNDVRFHSITQVSAKSSQEMIVMGDTTYVKDPSGVWWKQVNKPTDTKTDASPIKAPNLDDIKTEFTKKQDKTEFKRLGTEACGDRTCYKYQEIDAGNKEGVRTFWFDNKDFLLRRDEQKFGEFMTTNEYSYDNIKISAPSPTKDVPEGRSAFEYMMGTPATQGDVKKGTMPSKEELDKLLKQAGQPSDPQSVDTQNPDAGAPGN